MYQRSKSLPKKSKLHSLYPFIDANGLLQVGGSLQNSQLAFNHKHRIILPSQHKMGELLIKQHFTCWPFSTIAHPKTILLDYSWEKTHQQVH